MEISTKDQLSKKFIFNVDSECKRSGRGILHSASGDIYDCIWNDDRKSGVGFILYSNGDCFKGEFRDDK